MGSAGRVPGFMRKQQFEERVEEHRAVSRCIRVLALLAGGGDAVEMMPISHFIKLLRGTFSMNLLLSSR